MGKVARYEEKYKSRFCIGRLFLVTVRVFNRDSEKIVLVSYTCKLIGDLAIFRANQLALTQKTAKPFLDN